MKILGWKSWGWNIICPLLTRHGCDHIMHCSCTYKWWQKKTTHICSYLCSGCKYMPYNLWHRENCKLYLQSTEYSKLYFGYLIAELSLSVVYVVRMVYFISKEYYSNCNGKKCIFLINCFDHFFSQSWAHNSF